MRNPKYSNEITKLATVKQACERYKLCREIVLNIAEQGNCIRRFGRAVRIDIEEMDKTIQRY